MTKSELAVRLAKSNPHLHHRELELVVRIVFDGIAAALSRGDRVELRRFGVFSVKRLDARVGRDPRAGTTFDLPERQLPAFRPSRLLGNRLNRQS